MRRLGEILSKMPFLLFLASFFISDDLREGACSLLAVLVHEAGHCIAFYLLGGRCSARVRLCALSLDGTSLPYLSHIAVLLSGPLFNFTFFLLFFRFANFKYLCLFYGIINLLPIISLDGGEALCSFLSMITTDVAGKRICRVISFVFTFFLLFFSLYLLFRRTEGISLVLFAFLCLARHLENVDW